MIIIKKLEDNKNFISLITILVNKMLSLEDFSKLLSKILLNNKIINSNFKLFYDKNYELEIQDKYQNLEKLKILNSIFLRSNELKFSFTFQKSFVLNEKNINPEIHKAINSPKIVLIHSDNIFLQNKIEINEFIKQFHKKI